jgi:hypothetical protein
LLEGHTASKVFTVVRKDLLGGEQLLLRECIIKDNEDDISSRRIEQMTR